MDATLNVITKIVAYGDKTANSNPRLKFFDWYRDNSGIAVSDPKSEAHVIDPLGTKTIFDGTRSTTIDGTSAFSIALSTLDSSRYRISHTGGTAPGFRTDRALTLNTIAVTWAVNSNNTVNVTVPGLAAFDFTGVQVGDIVFIPHTTTGDSANVQSVLNAGYWQVLAVITTKNLQLTRLSGETFEAVGETVTLTANSQFQAFSSTGVQIGDHVDISAGFASATRKTFEIVAVTAGFIEIMSTTPLASETGITPGAAGMIFYTDSKSFLYIEADQECVVRVNGDSGNTQRLSPLEANNTDKPAVYMRRGPSWGLVVVNRSTSSLNITVIHAE